MKSVSFRPKLHISIFLKIYVVTPKEAFYRHIRC
jgi:hypothetical protein